MLKRFSLISSALLLAAAPAFAQNAPSGSSRVQGTPDGYGDPVQVTIVGPNGADTTLSTSSTISGNVASNATDSGNPVKIGCQVQSAPMTTPGAVADGNRVNVYCNPNGSIYIAAPSGGADAGSDARANLISLSPRTGGATTNTPLWTGGAVFNGTSWDRQRGDTTGTYVVLKPFTSGGLSAARVNSGTTGTVKASAGQLYHMTVINTNAAVRYLHLYNKASAPTLSTDTPIYTIPIAGGSNGREVDLSEYGLQFTTGIAWSYTTDDNTIPTTAGTSGELHASFAYK